MGAYFVIVWIPICWLNSTVLDFYGIAHPPGYDEFMSYTPIWIDWVVIGAMVLSQAVLGFLLSDSWHRRETDRVLADQQRFVFLGRIAASIAHEMRNPLHNIHLLTEHLRQGVTDEGQSRTMERVAANLARLDHAVLLAHELARPPIREDDPITCDPGRILLEVVDQERQRRPGADILVDDHAGSRRVVGRELSLRVVVENLLRNAVTAAGGTTVRIRMLTDAHWLHLRISNTGCLEPAVPSQGAPIPAEAQSPGLGIGLGIVRHLLAAVGGTLDLHQDGTQVVADVQLRLAD